MPTIATSRTTMYVIATIAVSPKGASWARRRDAEADF